MRAQQGLSLIELLITSTLGLLVISVAMTSYLSIKQSYRLHQALAQIQTTGQAATQFLSHDIHNATSISTLNNLIHGNRVKANTDSFALKNENSTLKIAYFIDQSNYKNLSTPITELNKKDLLQNHHQQDGLLLGISDMQVRYGVLSGAGLHFLRGEEITDWKKVEVVEINLLLDSLTSVFDSPQHYRFLDKDYLAKDFQLHKQWTFVARLKRITA